MATNADVAATSRNPGHGSSDGGGGEAIPVASSGTSDQKLRRDANATLVSNLRSIYWSAFWLSLLLSVVVFAAPHEDGAVWFGQLRYVLAKAQQHPASPPSKSGESTASAPTADSPAADTAASVPAKVSEELSLLRKIEKKVHPVASLPLALMQVLAVIAISVTWFYAFRLRGTLRRGRDDELHPIKHSKELVLTAIPVFFFWLGMYTAYQPAVLVMALVAIFVAAEHYSGLELQLEQLETASAELKDARQSLESIHKGTNRLLSDAGLANYVDAVYEKYRKARFIHAVVRLHDIDPDWWLWARDSLKSNSFDPWDKYFKEEHHIESPRTLTLRAALKTSDERPRLDAAFVTDLPMPKSLEWDGRYDHSEEPLFQDLLGLAWQLIVLNHSRKEGECNVTAWVSRPLCWVHATDQIAFQVLRRVPREHSTALVIADNVDRSNAAEKQANDGILAWAHEEIRRYIKLGRPAEEYLLAVFRYAMLQGAKDFDSSELVRIENSRTPPVVRASDDLKYILTCMGSSACLKEKHAWRTRAGPNHIAALHSNDDKKADPLEQVIADVFARFLYDQVRDKLPAGTNVITWTALDRELL